MVWQINIHLTIVLYFYICTFFTFQFQLMQKILSIDGDIH